MSLEVILTNEGEFTISGRPEYLILLGCWVVVRGNKVGDCQNVWARCVSVVVHGNNGGE